MVHICYRVLMEIAREKDGVEGDTVQFLGLPH